MIDMQNSKLVEIAKKRFDEIDSQKVHFTGDNEIDNFLNDLDRFPRLCFSMFNG